MHVLNVQYMQLFNLGFWGIICIKFTVYKVTWYYVDMNIIVLPLQKINGKVSSVVLFLWIKCKKVSHTMAF